MKNIERIFITASVAIFSLIMSIGHSVAWEKHFEWKGDPGPIFGGLCFLIPIMICVAFWGAVIVGIVYFIKWISRSGQKPEVRPDLTTEETALDILKKRYARGEITKEDFERMKQDIQ